MGGTQDVQLLKEDGTRLDGRRPDEMRPVHIEAGVLNRASGSSYLEMGGNKVIAGVYGPREAIPRHSQHPTRAVVKFRYNMAPFSVDDRKRPGPDRRSTEIGKVASEAFANVIILEEFPRAQVDINVEILEAAAGTRCAAISAASVALADAGIPMRGMVAACAAGKAGDLVCLDLNQAEDNHGEADLPIAMNMTTGEVVLLQMDGHLTPDEFETALTMAMDGCKEIYEIQKEALYQRYQRVVEGEVS